jgi:hypothetical protein
MTTAEKLQVLNVYLILMILLLVGKLYSAYWHAERKADRAAQEPSDLMEIAMKNIAMRKMQLQLRELLVYGEPDDLKDLMAEYMRLKEAQDKKDDA